MFRKIRENGKANAMSPSPSATDHTFPAAVELGTPRISPFISPFSAHSEINYNRNDMIEISALK